MASAASQDIQRAIMKHEGRYVGWRQNVDGEPATQLEASDVYSLGITIWEIFSGEVPFATIADRHLSRYVVDRKKRPERPLLLESQDAIWDLIQRCWSQPDSRSHPSISVVQRALEPHTTRLGLQIEALASIPRSESSSTGSLSDASANPPEGSLSKSESFSQLETKWTQSLRSKPPTWTRGHPNTYIDVLTIPQLPTDKEYKYRIVKGDNDFGIRPTYTRNTDGSQTINFLLEYNQGYGIDDIIPIKVYAVDPDEGEAETLIAKWDGSSRSFPRKPKRGG